ncbi:hypothetical protein ACTFIR_001013 [Dictyostelium discoideum]
MILKTIEYDYLCKIVVIGDSGVGKSNLLSRYNKNEFSVGKLSTIGVEFSTKTLKIDNKLIKLQLWDTAGQEKYNSITESFYKGAIGALIVYNIADRNSFNNLEKWLKKFRENAHQDYGIMLVGNKSDLKEYREVSTLEGKQFAEKHYMQFIETSALDSNNVETAFNNLFNYIYYSLFRNKTMTLDCNNNNGNNNSNIMVGDCEPIQFDQQYTINKSVYDCC